MEIGCILRNNGPEGLDAVRRIADLAAELGYASVWSSDHVVAPPEVAEPYGVEWLDPVVSLALVAERAPGVGLGISALVLPYRAALPTAKALATLQALSGGRLVAEVGSGWSAQEFAALGVDFASRGALTDERIEQIRAAFHDPAFAPADAVPLLAAGNGPVALRRARELRGWHPIGRPPSFIAAHTAALPPGTRVALRSRVALGRDRNGRPLFGTPDEVAADLTAYAAAGVTDLVVDYAVDSLADVESQLRELAGEGVPWPS